jgi:uncharacterized membrane protein YhhN
MALIGWLTLIIISTAMVHIRAEYLGPEWQIYVFKPLTMVYILMMAYLVKKPTSMRYRRWVMVALGLSLVGDVLLMLPVDLFLPGLVVFLLAQVVYVAAFWIDSPRERGPNWAPIPYVLYGVIVFSLLLPGLDDMQIPVLVYIVVICLMGWLALRRWRMLRNTPALLAAIGALFFLLSDTALAVNRFMQAFEAAPAVVLVTYYIAQYLLARSIIPETPKAAGQPA